MSKTLKYPAPVAGIDSLSSETSLIKGAVREASNVDISRSGVYRRRNGYARVIAGNNFHSMYSAAQKGWTLCVQDTALARLDTQSLVLTDLFALGSSAPVAMSRSQFPIRAATTSAGASMTTSTW